MGGGGLVAKLCPTLATPYLQPARLLCPCNSPGKNTGVGCHVLLQGIFLNPESNPGLLHCRQILYQLSQSTETLVAWQNAKGLWKKDGMTTSYPLLKTATSSSITHLQFTTLVSFSKKIEQLTEENFQTPNYLCLFIYCLPTCHYTQSAPTTSKGHHSHALVHLTYLLKDTATAAVPPLPHQFPLCTALFLWLHWVSIAVHELSQVAASGGHSSCGLLLLRSMGSVIVACGLSCPAACGICLDQESNP